MNLENKYWHKQTSLIDWNKKPKTIFEKKKNNKFEWFGDGKLNVAYNCLENKQNNNKIAIYFIDKNYNIHSYTFKQLSILVDKFAYLIKKKIKSKKKSNIIIHSSASIESAVSMLACAKLGYPHSVIFEDLSSKSVLLRIQLLKPTLIISRADNKQFNKDIVPAIQEHKDKSLVIFSFSNHKIKFSKVFNISIKQLDKMNSSKNSYNYFKSNNTLFTLFTSGSTGMPKGIMHSSGGYLLYSKYTCIKQFGMNKNSVVLTASDAGWINGHTYALYGPLSIGATTVLIEKPIILLNQIFLLKIINELKISILYLPVTLIRMLKSISQKNISKTKSLKTIGSMGEPLAPSVGKWYSNFFNLKDKAIINTYFQTETAGIIASPKYSQTSKEVPHGCVGKPINKFIKVKLDSPLDRNQSEKKVIKIENLWPGCMINVLNGLEQWNNYWDDLGRFNLFDLASYDFKKNINIHGRIDDVINIRGHRIGSEEIESIILKNHNISESCAIPILDKLEGNRIIIFLVLKNKRLFNFDTINKLIYNYFGSYALPKKIYILSELPKTRSGKILRRLLKQIIENPKKNDYGDISTLINPNIIKDIKKVLILNE